MLLLLVCAAGLAPGIATAWLLRHRGHGWPAAVAAGAALTLVLPALLLGALLTVPPLALFLAAGAALAALRAYDDGRVWSGTAWAGTALVCLSCAGWWTR
ncbi:hypothetical protein [Streptomyces sp. NPDC004042]|uniref:hypothetical protein n=1 Tax=Streptomyces sp. NPDC004042 TaxID=3154451 RepID=UPI0033B53A7F